MNLEFISPFVKLALLEKLLTVRGLVRDREQPDILVFMEFYSDRREQYVPPTEAVRTRYGEVITGILTTVFPSAIVIYFESWVIRRNNSIRPT